MIDFNQPQTVKPIAAAAASDAAVSRELRGLPLAGLLRAINHVIAQQTWARERLLAQRGKVIRLGIDSSFALASLTPNLLTRIGDDGLLQPVAAAGVADAAGVAGVAGTPDAAEAARQADVTLWLIPSLNALFAGLRSGPAGLSQHLRIEGDVLLAGVMAELAQNLRWDFEEDLSRVVGDVGARRFAGGVRSVGDQLKEGRQRIERQASQWLTAEQGQLVDRAALAEFREEIAALKKTIDALSSRLS